MNYTVKCGKRITTRSYGYFNTKEAWIELTQGQIVDVDAEDLDFLLGYIWHAHWNPTRKTYSAKNRTVGSMHRYIMGTPDRMHTDHRNHNTLDNRKENLRICTQIENSMNGKLPKNNKSGFKGVSWDKINKKWVAHIGNTSLGRFKNKTEAARAYDKAAVGLFDEFALTNEDMGLL